MKKGAVAFIDILGFKGIWQTRSESEILGLLTQVPVVIAKAHAGVRAGEGWAKIPPPDVVVLSDTIVVTLDSEEPQSLFILGNSVYMAMHHLFSGGLFVRGALGFGEYARSESTFLGPAIDDVASWYEVADWIGVITTPTTSFLIDRFSSPLEMGVNGFMVPQFIKWDVPGKGAGPFRLNAFNWPGYLQANFSELAGDGKSKARVFMESLFAKQAPFGASVLAKYENTLNFVDVASRSIRPKAAR